MTVVESMHGSELTNLPLGWKLVELGSCIKSIEAGKSFKCEERPPTENEVGVIKISAVTWGSYLEEESKTCLNSALVNERLFIKNGDFLFSRANTIELVGSCMIAKGVTKKIMLSDKVLRFNFDGVIPDYVLYFLRSRIGRKQIEELSTGNQESMRNIGQQRIKNIRIPLPSISVQKCIVAKIEELFSELDNGIAALKTAREQLKVYHQAILKHAFEGKLTAQWREENKDKLEAPEQLLARIQQEREARYQQQLEEWKQTAKEWEISGKEGKKPGKPKPLNAYGAISLTEHPYQLPQGWSWQNLGVLITKIDQGWSPKCENFPAKIDGWGVIKTTAVQHGAFNSDENKALPEHLAPREQHELKAGDILVTRAGPRVRVGVCCLVKEVREKLMNCDKVYRIRALENVCQPEYLETVLNSPIILSVLERVKSGINDSGVNLNQGEFLKMMIPYCSIKEQSELISKIDASLSVIDNQQETIETEMKHAETLRQSILKKAFSGQLATQEGSAL